MKCCFIEKSNPLALGIMISCFSFCLKLPRIWWDALHIPQASIHIESAATQVAGIAGKFENPTKVIHGLIPISILDATRSSLVIV